MSVLKSVTQTGTSVTVSYDAGDSTQNFSSEAEAADYAASMQAQIGQNLPQAFEDGLPVFARDAAI